MNKLKTLAWYLGQPSGIKLVRNVLLQNTLYKSREATAAESVKWCAARAIDNEAFFRKQFPGSPQPQDPFVVHADDYHFALQKVTETPYKLGGAGNTFLLYNCCKFMKAKSVIETGVAYGWSSLSVLLALREFPDAKLYSTDMPYANMGNEDFVGVVVPDKYRKQWELFKEADVSAMPKILKRVQSWDIVHYDSDKSYVGRMQTYPKLWRRLRSGGMFISDDIQDNVAFRDYSEKIGVTPTVISFDNKYVGVMIKP